MNYVYRPNTSRFFDQDFRDVAQSMYQTSNGDVWMRLEIFIPERRRSVCSQGNTLAQASDMPSRHPALRHRAPNSMQQVAPALRNAGLHADANCNALPSLWKPTKTRKRQCPAALSA